MTVCLLTIGDGRDGYHERSWASLREMLPDTDYTVSIDDRDHRLGFSGAYGEGFRRAAETGADYVFGAELDFTFRRPIPLNDMAATLAANTDLVQMALLRQPWNAAEKAAGGIIEQRPETYVRSEWGPYTYMAHRNFVTTNPALWPMWVIKRGWPQVPESEGRFGLDLFAERPEYRAAFWGAGEVWTDHIGAVRSGAGY